jgi:hypothetical protein
MAHVSHEQENLDSCRAKNIQPWLMISTFFSGLTLTAVLGTLRIARSSGALAPPGG